MPPTESTPEIFEISYDSMRHEHFSQSISISLLLMLSAPAAVRPLILPVLSDPVDALYPAASSAAPAASCARVSPVSRAARTISSILNRLRFSPKSLSSSAATAFSRSDFAAARSSRTFIISTTSRLAISSSACLSPFCGVNSFTFEPRIAESHSSSSEPSDGSYSTAISLGMSMSFV